MINYKQNIRRSLWCLIVLFLGAQTVQGQSVDDTLKQIDALFAGWNEETPGGVIRISRGGELLYHKAFGMADLEHDVANTTETIFEAGSVSKQFTATAVLLLVREGKVSLDEDVRKYIPELPEYEAPITLRHLMNHTSGLRDWGTVASIGGWPRTTRVYTIDHALDYIVRQKALNHAPGEEYLYSNSNYTLLTLVVERVSGQKLPDFTREHLFTPLGMRNTAWRDDFRQIIRNRAIGYDRPATGWQASGAYIMDMPFENTYGHAALLTTAADLDTWNRSWADSPLGGEELLRLRTEKGRLNNGEEIAYAGAVRVTDYNGHREVNHSGATAGYRAWMAWYPDKRLSVVYLSNDATSNVTRIGKSIAGIFFGELSGEDADDPVAAEKADSVNLTPEQLRELEGVYYSEECGGELNIEVKADTLQLFRKPAEWTKLSVTGTDAFRYGNTSVVFKRDANARVIGFTISVPRARNVLFERIR